MAFTFALVPRKPCTGLRQVTELVLTTCIRYERLLLMCSQTSL